VNSIVTGYWYLIATHVDKLSDRRQRRDLNAGIYGLISALVTLCSCPIADIKQWGGEAVRHIVHIASCTKFHMLVDFSHCSVRTHLPLHRYSPKSVNSGISKTGPFDFDCCGNR